LNILSRLNSVFGNLLYLLITKWASWSPKTIFKNGRSGDGVGFEHTARRVVRGRVELAHVVQASKERDGRAVVAPLVQHLALKVHHLVPACSQQHAHNLTEKQSNEMCMENSGTWYTFQDFIIKLLFGLASHNGIWGDSTILFTLVINASKKE